MSKRTCPNCGRVLVREGHFVPPSLGEPGFFLCGDIAILDAAREVAAENREILNRLAEK